MYKPTNKQYEFSSISDMLEFLTEDNIDLFLTDLRTMLLIGIDVKKLGGEMKSMGWIDDGKHDATLTTIQIDTNE